jgi:hypothetical protein
MDSVFDYPGEPVKKRGILFTIATNITKTFSFSAKFLATSFSGFILSIKSLISYSKISSKISS